MNPVFCLLLLFATGLSTTVAAQHRTDEKYIVTTYDDTTYCEEIKLKQLSVTCRTKSEKIEILNENVRRLYMPIEKSEWQDFFTVYANSGSKTLYPFTPDQVREVVTKNLYPRFFDLKPLDEEKDFWVRGLFEIIAQNNGYKLCKLKSVQNNTTPSFASEGPNLDRLIIFEEFEASGVEINKSNYRELLAVIMKGCPLAEKALKDMETNYFKEMKELLSIFAKCK